MDKAVTDRPILFSAPMVRALLDGRKTQTRRLATSKPMQRVRPGDRLWVKETYAKAPPFGPRYPATDDIHELRKVFPSIFMPRWASRLTLIVTETRTQPLQSIAEADARAEGIERVELYAGCSHYLDAEGRTFAFAQSAYASLWNTLHPRPGESWEDNPTVIALTFTVQRRNIDG